MSSDKYIFFDVGANTGGNSIPIAKDNPNAEVYAFEPTARLVVEIQKATSHLLNYHLIESAVSDYHGTAEFNVADDPGCSSLLPFSSKSHSEWTGRDFKVLEKYEVKVIRLDRFVRALGITKIDYLHVDTQGSDLKVLKGLGDSIGIVKKGVIEAATKSDILYEGQNTMDECVAFLESKGFFVQKIEANDPQANEVNIFFERAAQI